MRWKILFLLGILLLSFPVTAQESQNNYNRAKYLIIDSVVSFPVEMKSTSTPMRIDYIHVNYSWIPKEDYRQQLLDLTTTPKGEVGNESVLFDIKTLDDFNIQVSSKTRTYSDPVFVHEKVSFPIKELPSELVDYTKQTQLIDINDDIRSIAAGLASGEDDLYVVAFKVADWVNTNIEYNLSSVTSEASLKSSWVLKERQGVCDELSNLFVSMMRSLGVPARVVSGISYTNSPLFDYDWGAHGWTEVYFPEYGWIPFDPTYNQLGYVDATHIKMNDGADDDRYNTRYEWKGYGFSVEPGTQEIKSTIITEGALKSKDISMEINFLRDEVGYGSYNVVEVDVTNKKDYYVTKALSIANTEGIEIIDERVKDILLKPNEKKKVYWIIKTKEDLKEDYIYTFPISIYSYFNEEAKSNFKSRASGEIVSQLAAESIISNGHGTKLQSSDMSCVVDENVVYVDGEVEIRCLFSNNVFPNVNFCIEEDCNEEQIENGEIRKSIVLSDSGYHTFAIQASADKKIYSAFVSVNVVEPAEIVIENITYNHKIKYDESAAINFVIRRTTSGVPKDVKVTISHEMFSNQWELNKLVAPQKFKFEVYGKNLKTKENNLIIKVDYSDEMGKEYSVEKSIFIEPYDINVFQWISLWFNELNLALQ